MSLKIHPVYEPLDYIQLNIVRIWDVHTKLKFRCIAETTVKSDFRSKLSMNCLLWNLCTCLDD